MKKIINFQIDRTILMIIINIILILLLMISKFHIINISIIILYGIITFFLDNKYKILNWIIAFILIDFLTQNLWYSTHYEFNTYTIYIKLSIVIGTIFSILINFKKYINIIKDPIICLQIIFVLLNILHIFDPNYNFNDFINGIYQYISPVLIYILILYSEFRFKKIYKIIFYIQAPLVLFEYMIYKDQDQISGVFGLYGITTSMLFLSLSIYWMFFKTLKEKDNWTKVVLCLIYCFIIFVLGEVKMAFVLIPLTIGTIVFVVRGNFIKKIITILFVSVTIIIGMNSLIMVYPEFKDILFNMENLKKYSIDDPVGTYKYSRGEALEFINENINKLTYDKLLGKGIGSAVRNKNFVYKLFARGRNYVEIKDSTYYEKYEYTGYTTTSLNVFYIECGIIGFIIYLGIIIIILSKSISLVKKSDNVDNMAIGIIAICFIECWLGIFWYSNMLYNTSATMIFWIIAGVVSKSFKEIRLENSK